MARQPINFDPARKLFEAFMDFSGGLNLEVSNERLKDNEYPVLDNVSLASRGSAKLRYGRRKVSSGIGNNAQGVFFYYRQGAASPDVIKAINGRLYRVNGSTDVEIPITDNGQPFTFQTTLPIEAVQYHQDLFIATGTKLVELTYTGGNWVAKTVTPYTPSVMEAIYIGTNGLADNPDAYVQDGTSTNLEVAGIKPSMRYAVANQKITFTAYINKPASITSVDYKWEYKKSADTTWTVGRDWTANAAGKTWEFSFDTAVNHDIRVSVRNTASPSTIITYALTRFEVKVVSDGQTILPVNGIQKCRKIILHWDRILLSLDDTNPYQMYISDLNNPRYFPVTNTISWDTGKQEAITSIVRYRDMLIVFTKTTIQTLVGKSTEDYKRSLIHDGIGCVADRTAKVVGNNIVFLSHEGIFILKPNPFILEVMNVARIDFPIKSAIIPKSNACAITADSQYWIAFPDQSTIFRLDYENNTWVRDVSTKLDIVQFLQYGEDVYELRKNGDLLIHDKSIFTDDNETYKMVVETKAYDLSASFNYKKLKRLYLLSGADENVALTVSVFADSAQVLGRNEQVITVDENGYITWEDDVQPNFQMYAGTVFGKWLMGFSPFGGANVSVQKATIRGKCRRVKVRIEFNGGSPCEIFGLGLEFKLKKP